MLGIILLGYSAYLLFLLLELCIPFYFIFNTYNLSITFLIALSWILFSYLSYLLTLSLLQILYSIIIVTIFIANISVKNSKNKITSAVKRID